MNYLFTAKKTDLFTYLSLWNINNRNLSVNLCIARYKFGAFFLLHSITSVIKSLITNLIDSITSQPLQRDHLLGKEIVLGLLFFVSCCPLLISLFTSVIAPSLCPLSRDTFLPLVSTTTFSLPASEETDGKDEIDWHSDEKKLFLDEWRDEAVALLDSGEDVDSGDELRVACWL